MDVPVENPPNAVKLPLRFDPAGLQEDLRRLGAAEWIAHFNQQYYEGIWSGVNLRSPQGAGASLYGTSQHAQFDDTGVLARCPALRQVVESFQCPLRSVRLLKLTAGSTIQEHCDYDLGYKEGEVRIHVPVVTHSRVEFFLEGRRILMGEGECWYLDLSRPHRVRNRGTTDRVHLVIDCRLNDWLRELIAQGIPDPGVESGFEPFRRRVLGDRVWQRELMEVTDREAFALRAVALGEANRFSFETGDVTSALNAGRKAWTELWIA